MLRHNSPQSVRSEACPICIRGCVDGCHACAWRVFLHSHHFILQATKSPIFPSLRAVRAFQVEMPKVYYSFQLLSTRNCAQPCFPCQVLAGCFGVCSHSLPHPTVLTTLDEFYAQSAASIIIPPTRLEFTPPLQDLRIP